MHSVAMFGWHIHIGEARLFSNPLNNYPLRNIHCYFTTMNVYYSVDISSGPLGMTPTRQLFYNISGNVNTYQYFLQLPAPDT